MNTDGPSPAGVGTDVLSPVELARLRLYKRAYDDGWSLGDLRRLFFARWLVQTGRLSEWPAPQEEVS